MSLQEKTQRMKETDTDTLREKKAIMEVEFGEIQPKITGNYQKRGTGNKGFLSIALGGNKA